MKCQNCNSELLEDAKFCTTCGTPVAVVSAGPVCPKCNAPLLEDAKFCTTCGAAVESAAAEAPQAPDGQAAGGGELATVKQKIFWNIQKGEVACRVNESEFIRYDSAQGLIVNDGTTAYIKANGKVLAEIHGGIYDFVDPDELKRVLESRTGGAAGLMAGSGRFLINALLGRRVKDKFDDKDAPERQRSLDAVIESMKRHEAFSLLLKLDKSFSLVFGSGTAEDMAEFRPMSVRTKLLDLQVGLRVIFRIADFNRFAEYFLTDEPVATTRRIAEKLQPVMQNAVQAVMQDRQVEGTSIPAEVAEAITARIAASGDQFYGLALERVAEVVASNEDLERLRSLSRELYLSEQELDYLRRTNDFRNRLAAETNSQAIADARSDMQLYEGLQQVNKDRLLADDELDKFYTVLSREKRIRDARSEDEVEAALADIEKTGLLREEDVDNLRIDVAERRYRRGEAIKLMQLRDRIEFEKVRTAGEGQVAVEQMRQGLELQELTLAHRKREDEYSDERRARERELQRADRQSEIELDNAEMDAQIERLRKVKELNREDKKMDLDHEREMERLKQEALDKKARMTAEQLMAVAAGENLDSQAAVKFAESFSAGKNAEQVQQAADARIADSQRHEDRMLEMMREMKDMATTMTGHIVQNKDAERDRYRERMERQEEDGFGSRARDGAPEAGSPRQEGADDGRAADGRGCGREPRFAGRGEVRRVVLGGKERRTGAAGRRCPYRRFAAPRRPYAGDDARDEGYGHDHDRAHRPEQGCRTRPLPRTDGTPGRPGGQDAGQCPRICDAQQPAGGREAPGAGSPVRRAGMSRLRYGSRAGRAFLRQLRAGSQMSTAMERYQGVILIRLQNAGSKSEGHYAFLVRDDDMSVVKLCREGAVPADDPYFVPFDRQEVVVTGTMSHGWLVASAVEQAVAGDEADSETEENNEQA